MNDKLIVDTNIIIYAFQGNNYIIDLIEGENLAISFITEIELLSWPKLTEQEILELKKFIHSCRVIEYSSSLKELVISIRKKYNLKMSDAFIAASAILDESPLLSGDNIFSKVKEIQFFQIKTN